MHPTHVQNAFLVELARVEVPYILRVDVRGLKRRVRVDAIPTRRGNGCVCALSEA